MKKYFGLFLIVFLMASGFGCSSKYMKPASIESISALKPGAGESIIIFMRPSAFGGAIQSSVFDVTTSENVLAGIVSSKTKVAHRTSPGEHLFMVVGESADFMKANLDGGKTYYALVTPRMGVWKARFSLKPVHLYEISSSDFKGWDSSCDLYENTEASYQWAKDNGPSIQSKREEYFQKWMSKSDEDRPVLNREDGI